MSSRSCPPCAHLQTLGLTPCYARAGLTLSPSLTAVREASDEERSDGDQPADTAVPAAAESRPASGYALM